MKNIRKKDDALSKADLTLSYHENRAIATTNDDNIMKSFMSGTTAINDWIDCNRHTSCVTAGELFACISA